MSIQVTTQETFDITKLSIGSTFSRNEMRFITLLYDQKPMYLKTPAMRVPFKPNQFSATSKWSINLEISDQCALLQANLTQLDQWMIEQGVKSCVEWLGAKPEKPYSTEVVAGKYTNTLKESKDPRYPPSIRANFKNRGSELLTHVYDHNSQPVDVGLENNQTHLSQVIKQNTQLAVLLTPSLWANTEKGTFGVSWSIEQAKIYPSPSTKQVLENLM